MLRALIFALALLAPAAAQAAWREASTPHFLIYSEENAATLQAFATRLEKFDKAMRMMRGMDDPPVGPANRLTIYVVPSVASVQRVMGRDGRNLAGVYIPRATGSIAIVPRKTGGTGAFALNAETVLLHEYAHHFMFANAFVAYPAWFVEGFAEFNSTTKFEKDGSLGFGLPAAHRAYGLMMLKFPVETLLGSDVSSLSQEAAEAFYGRGWLLTHYLTFEPSRKGQLNAYLKAINAGEKSLPAARRIFGDLKRLDAEIGKYVMRSRLPFLRYSPAEIPIGPVRIRELSPGEDAMMELKIRSRRGVDLAEAKELLPKMRKAAAPFPKDPAVQATLAEAEFDARNYAEAEAAADRALAADPKHVDALVYKGRALMAKATAAKASDAATWRDVRRWFATANKADPEDAEPLFFYYDSYNAQGIPPTRIAAAGLLKAFDLVPQDRGLRMLVARQYLIDGKAEEARSALSAVAYDPHGGELGKAAATLLAILEKGGAKSALESLSTATAAESD